MKNIDELLAAFHDIATHPGKQLKHYTDAGKKVVGYFPIFVPEEIIHVGHTSTMPLIPEIVDSVNIPVIAAGGIFDGRGMCAAFALGAEGIQMGTRFICAEETNVHADYKQLIIQAKDDPTVVTGASIGHPVRAIKNKLIDTFIELEGRKAPIEEIQKLGTGKLRLAVETGDQDMGSFQCGEVCGVINAILPAKTIIEEVITSFEATRKKLTS